MNLAHVAPRSLAEVSDVDTARSIGRAAVRSLWHELALYPKPGLVSLRDSGAHGDMDAATFIRSLFAMSRYFHDIAIAGASSARFETLRRLGVRAEAAMLAATGGVNTHRGAIFAVGLLCATAARAHTYGAVPTDRTLRRMLIDQWGNALAAFEHSPIRHSHGAVVVRRYGAAGARSEARRAFPAVFDIALPALREALKQGVSPQRARLAAFFALLGHVDDTNVLHRCGAEGLAFVRRRAREFRERGGVFRHDALIRAEAIHREFVAARLSPGGCADLLAATLFVHSVTVQ